MNYSDDYFDTPSYDFFFNDYQALFPPLPEDSPWASATCISSAYPNPGVLRQSLPMGNVQPFPQTLHMQPSRNFNPTPSNFASAGPSNPSLGPQGTSVFVASGRGMPGRSLERVKYANHLRRKVEARLTCYCGDTFTGAYSLKRKLFFIPVYLGKLLTLPEGHRLSVHEGRRDNVCPMCNRMFATYSSLRRHWKNTGCMSGSPARRGDHGT